MKDRFYLACFRDNVGSNVGWHCKDGKGYSTDVSKAHVYTRAQAQKEWTLAREYDQPISADHVDELTIWKVDSQYISTETKIIEGVNEYVAYVKGRWNGNDVYWLNTGIFTTSLNFETASIFSRDKLQYLLSHPEFKSKYVVIPYQDAEKAERPTFDMGKFDRKEMAINAGLEMPERFKKKRRRVTTGKTRFNCPSCGRMNWQQNPHDFVGCQYSTCVSNSHSI